MIKEQMKQQQPFTFEAIFAQNQRRVHYQLHKRNSYGLNGYFFQVGLVTLWNAYERYQPDKGPMATYFNYMIRNLLIDLPGKETRSR